MSSIERSLTFCYKERLVGLSETHFYTIKKGCSGLTFSLCEAARKRPEQPFAWSRHPVLRTKAGVGQYLFTSWQGYSLP